MWWTVSSHRSLYEPRHDKTNKMSVRPAQTQISLGIRPVWSESSLCAQWVDPMFLHADSEDSDQTGRKRRLWSDWAEAQADLSLRWAHTYFVGFVMSWLIYHGCYVRTLNWHLLTPYGHKNNIEIHNKWQIVSKSHLNWSTFCQNINFRKIWE